MKAGPSYPADSLHEFCSEILRKLGVPPDEAKITADVLIDTDLRGIDSHGIAHLARYALLLRSGSYRAKRIITVVRETASTALVDGGGGLGHPAGVRAMELAIHKAREVGSSCVVVRNSHHFGAAGYYAAMALEHDMIGYCATNAGPGVLPTFGIQPQVGTNPIALAVPANREPPFVLDMATSAKAYGKLEIAIREGRDVPAGWFLMGDGSMGCKPQDFPHWRGPALERRGGLLPLGGAGEETSGYKGYGLALGVELLAPLLAGDPASPFMDVYPDCPEPAIAHHFGAIRVDAFRPVEEYKADVDRLLAAIRASAKAPGHNRIYVAGEKEYECMKGRKISGIPLHPKVMEELTPVAEELGVSLPEPLKESPRPITASTSGQMDIGGNT